MVGWITIYDEVGFFGLFLIKSYLLCTIDYSKAWVIQVCGLLALSFQSRDAMKYVNEEIFHTLFFHEQLYLVQGTCKCIKQNFFTLQRMWRMCNREGIKVFIIIIIIRLLTYWQPDGVGVSEPPSDHHELGSDGDHFSINYSSGVYVRCFGNLKITVFFSWFSPM